MKKRGSAEGEIEELVRKRRRIRVHESRRMTLRWIGIIIIISAFTIGLLQLVPPLFKQIEIMDKSYSPRDLERYKQIYKMLEGKADKTQKDMLDKLK